MNDFYSLKKRELSLQIEMLISFCLQTSFSIGSSCVASTSTYFDSRAGFISIDVYPHGANHELFDGRIAFNVTCDEDSKEKLCILYAYLIDVLNNGYSKFGGFSPVQKAS